MICYIYMLSPRLCYTPMMHAEDFAGSGEEEMFRQGFATCPEDRRWGLSLWEEPQKSQ